MTDEHFSQKVRRKAEFFTTPNTLKKKVGSGGLSLEILKKAQVLLDNNTVDFKPIAEGLVDNLYQVILEAKKNAGDQEKIIGDLLFPALHLKQSGGMFKYTLVTNISDRLVQFLEVIDNLDDAAIEVIEAFNTTLRAIIVGQIKGDGGPTGKDLYNALVQACVRYFEKFPENKGAD